MDSSELLHIIKALDNQFDALKAASLRDKAQFRHHLDTARERNRQLEAHVAELTQEIRLLKQQRDVIFRPSILFDFQR